MTLLNAHCTQYLRVTGAGPKAAKKAGGRLAAFHPGLFVYNTAADDGSASAAVPKSVPESYIALGRACVSDDPLVRPTFEDIIRELENVKRDIMEGLNDTSETVSDSGAEVTVSSPAADPVVTVYPSLP